MSLRSLARDRRLIINRERIKSEREKEDRESAGTGGSGRGHLIVANRLLHGHLIQDDLKISK